jgi:hypothetical protein
MDEGHKRVIGIIAASCGSVKTPHEDIYGPIQLTADGYNKYLPQIKALRALG